jgi:hypothetical protein
MLAETLLMRRIYDHGVFVLISPKLNTEVQKAARLYAEHLAAPLHKAGFRNVTLEDTLDLLRDAGAAEEAMAIRARYTDFTSVHDLI